ncbi:C2 domain-containing protein [Blyttiomyces helicus]|uniref:C2 domain-containing protein n=1 Tax=Blyttiomyces helicus TaxID=388810 RepID=A0A4P9VZS0_9FUNG|nr:C2 domain-containing protein [Blyttiomyces helicus]|eukprot:RKO84525.1 C2 domain-containing protein [Blyttiomyces helicus]
MAADWTVVEKISVKIVEAKWEDKQTIRDDLELVNAVLGTLAGGGGGGGAEEFIFDDVRGFRDLKVVVWNEDKTGVSRPVGKVVFPRRFLSGEDEQWYNLMNADTEGTVSGELRVKIKYFPPKDHRATYAFSVRVIGGRNLSIRNPLGTPPDPFAVIHLLPDPEAHTTQQTRVQRNTVNPAYSDVFIFTVDTLEPDQELHFSVWDNASLGNEQTVFLGHLSVPLLDVVMRGYVDRWCSLAPYPASAPQTRKTHTFEEAGFAFSYCSHCAGVMVGTHLQFEKICRCTAEVLEMLVLGLAQYEKLLQCVEEDDFFSLNVLGRVSQEREEAARSLVRGLGQAELEAPETAIVIAPQLPAPKLKKSKNTVKPSVPSILSIARFKYPCSSAHSFSNSSVWLEGS